MRHYSISRAIVKHVAPGLKYPSTSIARKAVRVALFSGPAAYKKPVSRAKK